MRSEEQIREFIQSLVTKINSPEYLYPAYEGEEDYYRQEGRISGYEEALDDLMIFLDGES